MASTADPAQRYYGLFDDLAETRAELRAREAFDAACDNDGDGLG
jgi:hypothetical protein